MPNVAHQDTIRKAIENVATNIHDIDDVDVYTLAIAAYALQLADHAIKDQILDRLVSQAIEKGKNLIFENRTELNSPFVRYLQVIKNGGPNLNSARRSPMNRSQLTSRSLRTVFLR